MQYLLHYTCSSLGIDPMTIFEVGQLSLWGVELYTIPIDWSLVGEIIIRRCDLV